MNVKKSIFMSILILLAFLMAACEAEQEVDVAVAIALTQTAAAPAQAEAPADAAASSGFISGSASLFAPPTPPLVIYALDTVTGNWAFVETLETEMQATFTLEVPPGNYLVFAFPPGLGHTQDGMTLTPVSVQAGQTVSGIELAPPGPSDCGPLFGVPAAPDGRYAEIPNPDANCIASLQAPQSEDVAPIESELMRIEFAPGDDSTQLFGSLPPNGINHYVLTAMAGQEMTVSLDVFDGNPTTFAVWGADGTILNPYDTSGMIWTGTLPLTQDYFIDILSRDSQATADYALVVVIPATAQAPADNLTGGIAGATNYPEATSPPMHIVATHLESGSWYWIGTAQNAGSYTITNLPPGSYHIAAYTQHGLIGGHSDANGSFIPVMVGAVELVDSINLSWWPRGDVVNDPVGW